MAGRRGREGDQAAIGRDHGGQLGRCGRGWQGLGGAAHSEGRTSEGRARETEGEGLARDGLARAALEVQLQRRREPTPTGGALRREGAWGAAWHAGVVEALLAIVATAAAQKLFRPPGREIRCPSSRSKVARPLEAGCVKAPERLRPKVQETCCASTRWLRVSDMRVCHRTSLQCVPSVLSVCVATRVVAK